MADIRAFFNQNGSSYGATANQKQNEEVKNAVVTTMKKIMATEDGRDSESDTEEDRKMPGDKEIDAAIPQNYQQALSHVFESNPTEVVMLLVRTSPGTGQDIIAVAAGTCALYELYCSSHPDKNIDFYKAIFVSKDASRHSPGGCVGIAHLMHAIEKHHGLRGKEVTVLARDCVRITHDPDDLDDVVGTLSDKAQRSGIRTFRIISGDSLHLDLTEESQKVHERDRSLREVSKVHSQNNVAKALDDNRSKEEIKQQDGINKCTTKLMEEHGDASRQRIHNMYNLVNEGLPKNIVHELAKFKDDLLNSYPKLKNAMSDNEKFTKICKKLIETVKVSTLKLPDGISDIDKIGYTRFSPGKDNSIRVGDIERGTIGEAANIPLRQLMSMFAVVEKEKKAKKEFAIFLDDGKGRHEDTFHQGLIKMLFFAIKLSGKNVDKNPTVYVSTVVRFGSGNPPVAVKSTVQMLRQLGLKLVVTSHIGYDPTDMMDSEWERVLRMKIIRDEYREEKEKRVSKLSIEKQEQHYAFAKLGRTQGSFYVKEFTNKMAATATKSGTWEGEEGADLKPAAKVTTIKRKRRDDDDDYTEDD